MIPNTLYHGSFRDNPVLQPGFNWTKQIVRWDKTESNEYLYTAKDESIAIMSAMAALVESHTDIGHFYYGDNRFEIFTNQYKEQDVRSILSRYPVFLYTIHNAQKHQFKPVNNENNLLEDEYKTKSIIKNNDFIKQQINPIVWMNENHIKLIINPNINATSKSSESAIWRAW